VGGICESKRSRSWPTAEARSRISDLLVEVSQYQPAGNAETASILCLAGGQAAHVALAAPRASTGRSDVPGGVQGDVTRWWLARHMISLLVTAVTATTAPAVASVATLTAKVRQRRFNSRRGAPLLLGHDGDVLRSADGPDISDPMRSIINGRTPPSYGSAM
jgi:hypothetical protein